MSAQHTEGRVVFREDGDANHWSMLTEDGRWWLALLANGEQTTPRQVANFRRLAACWNACEGLTTEALERLGTLDRARVNLDVIRAEAIAQRDALLAACRQAEPVLADMERLLQARVPGFTGLAALQAVRQAVAKAVGGTS